MHYPMMVDLSLFKIVVIGGGQVAYRKTSQLLAFGGKITVVSLKYSKLFKQLSDNIERRIGGYEETLLNEFNLVIAATNDKACNQRIGESCRKRQILCNVASAPHLSSFIVPSIVKRGDLVISISTGGKSPSLAQKIKKEIEEQYDEQYENYVALLGQWREKMMTQISDPMIRRKKLKELAQGDYSSLLVMEQDDGKGM